MMVMSKCLKRVQLIGLPLQINTIRLRVINSGHLEVYFSSVFVHWPLSAKADDYLKLRGQLLFSSFFCQSIESNCSYLHSCCKALIWPHVFGLDEPVAQRNKPVCLLHKPMFRAYMLWRLYTALKKKGEKSHFSCCVDKEMGGKKQSG